MKLKKPAFNAFMIEGPCHIYYEGRRYHLTMLGRSESVYMRSRTNLEKLPRKSFKIIAPTPNNVLHALKVYGTDIISMQVHYKDKFWKPSEFERTYGHLLKQDIDPLDGDPYQLPEE